MRVLRTTGTALLAIVAIVVAFIWIANAFDYIKPLVVTSGSMEPAIHTGDLLLNTAKPTSELKVGDPLSLTSEITGKIVTHRVTAIDWLDGGGAEVRMKGDANTEQDAETYIVGDSLSTPVVQIPGGGYLVGLIQKPMVREFLLIAVLAWALFEFVSRRKKPNQKRSTDLVPTAISATTPGGLK